MKKIGALAVLLIAFGATASMAQSAAGKRDVVLNLTLPNGGTPQLRITEGGTGSVELPNVGKFGFVPAFRDGNDHVVVVDLFDLSRTPSQRIDRLELAVGGDKVQSATTPQFGVQVVKIVKP